MIDPRPAPDTGKVNRITEEARRWIGTPYHHRASLRGVGTDCLGLIRGVWRDLYGEEPEPLPDYSPDWAEATGAETMSDAAARNMDAIPVDDVRPGDVVLLRLRRNGPARHAGILAERDGTRTMIHAPSRRAVCEEPFDARWERALACAFCFPDKPEL